MGAVHNLGWHKWLVAPNGTRGKRWEACQLLRRRSAMSIYCTKLHVSGNKREKECQSQQHFMYRFTLRSLSLNNRLNMVYSMMDFDGPLRLVQIALLLAQRSVKLQIEVASDSVIILLAKK